MDCKTVIPKMFNNSDVIIQLLFDNIRVKWVKIVF